MGDNTSEGFQQYIQMYDEEPSFKVTSIRGVGDLGQADEALDQAVALNDLFETSALGKRTANQAVHRVERENLAEIIGLEKDFGVPSVNPFGLPAAPGVIPSQRPDTSNPDRRKQLKEIVDEFLTAAGLEENRRNKDVIDDLVAAMEEYVSNQLKTIRSRRTG
jgi:hypothetical protein